MPSGVYRRKPWQTRFWERVEKKGPIHPTLGPCWVWTAGKHKFGYGVLSAGDLGFMTTHRLSWILNRGPIPDRRHVLHKCDNPSCVNPTHLFLGTHTDNMVDCVRKGRLRPGRPDNRGERNGQATLKIGHVKVILLALQQRPRPKGLVKTLAKKFRLSEQHVRRIGRGVAWKHVTSR